MYYSSFTLAILNLSAQVHTFTQDFFSQEIMVSLHCFTASVFLEIKGLFFIYSVGCGLDFICLELLGSICIDKISNSGPHYFEDLVDMMYDTISDSFNADFEDNSVEEVIYFPCLLISS